MASDVISATPFQRFTTVAALVTTVVALGVAGYYMKNTGTGESATRDIYCWKSSSGSGLCIRENGSVNASGSYLINGVALPTSSGLSFTNAEGIYVNQKGDTMTGTLIIDTANTISLDAKEAVWAQSLHATGSSLFLDTLVIDTSNAISFNGKEATWVQSLHAT